MHKLPLCFIHFGQLSRSQSLSIKTVMCKVGQKVCTGHVYHVWNFGKSHSTSACILDCRLLRISMMQRILPEGRVALPLDAHCVRQHALSPTHNATNAARSAPCPWHASSRFCCQAAQSAEVASTSGRQSHIRFEDLIETPGLREPSPNGALQPEDHNNFVRFFRMASPTLRATVVAFS